MTERQEKQMRKVQELGPVSGGGFDLAAALKGVPDLNTGEEQIVRLPLEAIDPDPDNFYSLEGLDELAGNIETVGLLDPIRVRPNGERYTVVSGHRRRAACLLIRDGGNPMFEGGVPCIVEYGEASDAMRRLRLIYANANTRQLTSAEQSKQAEEVTRLLYELKEQGVEFPGRMRDHVAQACNLTKSKIGRLHAIRSRAQEYVLDAFDQGKINESVAYELQKLPLHLQKRIYVNQIHMGYKVEALTADEVIRLAKLYQKLALMPCKQSAIPCSCVRAGSLFDRAQRNLSLEGVTDACAKGHCCLSCRNLGTCKDFCAKCGEEKAKQLAAQEKRKQDAERERALTQIARERAREQQDEENATVWARLRKAAETSGVGLGNVLAEFCETRSDVDEALRFANGMQTDTNHFGLVLLDDCLIDLADALGCSVDFLLGRTEAVRPAGEGDAAPEPRWLTGTPEKEGWYACLGVWADIPERTINYWRGAWYEEKNSRRVMKDVIITAFFPLPDMEG